MAEQESTHSGGAIPEKGRGESMNPSDPGALWIPLLLRLAAVCDTIAMRYFRATDLTVEQKADASPVSRADREIERRIREILAGELPELGVLGEEEAESSGAGAARLILDPIDGTRNYVRGIPIFATLLAIEEGREIVAGLVSAPALGTRWWGARGGGAYRDGQPIRVSALDTIGRAQIFHGDLGGRSETPPPGGIRHLLANCERSRGFGDFYQHMLVAEGAGEAAIDPSVKPWDVAPILVIVEEAGGRATSLDGVRSIRDGSLVSTNGILHGEVLDLLTPPR